MSISQIEEKIKHYNSAQKQLIDANIRLEKMVMPFRNELFEQRDRKSLISLCKILPVDSEAYRFTRQLIFRLDDLEIDGEI